MIEANVERCDKGRNPTADEKAAIRRRLSMRRGQPWNTCKYRSVKRARELDRELGFTEEEIALNKGVHTKEGHSCALCRCKNIAGAGTRGWWYWPKQNPEGLGEIGHYGVGPCHRHSPYNTPWIKTSLGHPEYIGMIQKEIEAMQTMGAAPDQTGQWLVEVKQDGARAVLRNELRGVVEEVRELADELKEKLEGGTALTELSGGKEVDMSDKTKYELRLKLLKSISDLTKTELDASQWEMFHSDQVVMFLNTVLQAAEMTFKPKCTDEEWQDFLTDMKAALKQMKPGRAKR